MGGTKTALVTGATGQDGRYLLALLHRHGYVVHAHARHAAPDWGANGARWHIGDLTDAAFLAALICETEPDEIYNLAAMSRPTLSWSAPRETAEVNAFLPHQLCEVLVKHRPGTRLFQASSSDMFGDGFVREQDEATPCEPATPYGAAKLYAHRIIGAYRARFGLHACCGILFNHESPYRPLTFVSQKIAFGAALLSLGVKTSRELDERGKPIVSNGKLMLGDLGVRRDFGFAGDTVEAMHMILQHPVAGDYVVGTGEEHSVQEFCDLAFRAVGLDWTDHVMTDPKLLRKTDSHYTRANPAKLRAEIGWQPQVGFDKLVEMMVYARLEALDRPVRLTRPHTS